MCSAIFAAHFVRQAFWCNLVAEYFVMYIKCCILYAVHIMLHLLCCFFIKYNLHMNHSSVLLLLLHLMLFPYPPPQHRAPQLEVLDISCSRLSHLSPGLLLSLVTSCSLQAVTLEEALLTPAQLLLLLSEVAHWPRSLALQRLGVRRNDLSEVPAVVVAAARNRLVGHTALTASALTAPALAPLALQALAPTASALTTQATEEGSPIVWTVQMDNGPLDRLCYVNLARPNGRRLRQFGPSKWTLVQWTVHFTSLWTIVHLDGPFDRLYCGNLDRPKLQLRTVILDCPKIRLSTVILERPKLRLWSLWII